jgi:hypothetical protein
MDLNWCENSLGDGSIFMAGVKIALATAPFSWLRGGSARAMDHFGEFPFHALG